MRLKYILVLSSIILGCYFLTLFCSRCNGNFNVGLVDEKTPFALKRGDILVRPNWAWLPGSCSVRNGGKYGHVAIVTSDAAGNTIEEVLEKAMVVEALFFDQGTRSFRFKKQDQIREAKASVSFGSRFKDRRYRLRLELTEDQAESIKFFLRNQLEGGYGILSGKRQFTQPGLKEAALANLKNQNWHCATLAWEAYYLVAGLDIDANHGFVIYPNDIIASENFSLPGSRIRF